jgi:hypothetical protein
MGLTSTVSRNQYNGADSVGPFTYSFRIFDEADLRVTKRNSVGLETTLTLTTDYTVTGVKNASGTITLTTALATGEVLTIRRVRSVKQATSIRNQARYSGSLHEDALDAIIMSAQSMKDQLDRSFRVRETYDPATYSLDLKPETGKVVGWITDTQLGSMTLDASATALPGESRTVATLTAYLLNNAVYNVKDYAVAGVVGRAAFAAADAAAVAGGGVVLVPNGTYTISSDITIASPVICYGILKPASGKTITFNARLDGLKKLFDLSLGGTIAFSTGNPTVLRVEWFGTVGDGATDDTTAINNFFTCIATYQLAKAVFAGYFAVTTITLSAAVIATKVLECDVTLQALAGGSDWVWKIAGAQYCRFPGRIEIFGTGASTYSTRTRKVGLQIENSKRANFDLIKAWYFLIHGVYLPDVSNTNHINLGTVVAQYCGALDGMLTATISVRADAGSSGSINQTSVLTVDVLPDATYGVGSIVQIGGAPSEITAINPGASQITVYPWPPLGSGVGTLISYHLGAGLRVDSASDNNVISVSGVSALNCGVGADLRQTYFGKVDRCLTTACGTGIAFGTPNNSTQLGTNFTSPYFEANTFDVVKLTAANVKGALTTPIGLDYSKMYALAPRTSGDVYSSTFAAVNGLVVIDGVVRSVQPQKPFNGVSSSETINVGDRATFRANTLTLNLAADVDLNRLFGVTDCLVWALGTGNNDNATGTWTFQPSAGGYTVMGGATYAVSGLARPTLFYCYLNGTDWRVFRFSSNLAELDGSVTTQFDKAASTAFATVTGLSLNLPNAGTYSFEALLYVTADATGGQKYQMTGAASPTQVNYDVEIIDITGKVIAAMGRATALSTSVALAGAANTAYQVRIRGTVTPTAAGTFNVQFAQNSASGTSSVLVGSSLKVRQVA